MTTTRNPDPAARALLATVHRLVVHQRPYEEVTAALDTAAALPEAADPDAATLIALERLEAAFLYSVSDDEVERVLEMTATERSKLPTSESAWLLRSVCMGRPALAERHLAPLLAELESREVEDEGAAKTVDLLRRELSVMRGEPQEDDEDDDIEDEIENEVDLAPEEFAASLRYAYRLKRMGWPYDDVIAVLDEVAARPVAAGYQGWIMRDRLMLTDMYQRPDEDMDRLLKDAMVAFAAEPVKHRASTIAAACSERPALAERYIPPLVDELEQELRRSPDPEGAATLAGIERVLQRARGGP
jgi:hypothetical protein